MYSDRCCPSTIHKPPPYWIKSFECTARGVNHNTYLRGELNTIERMTLTNPYIHTIHIQILPPPLPSLNNSFCLGGLWDCLFYCLHILQRSDVESDVNTTKKTYINVNRIQFPRFDHFIGLRSLLRTKLPFVFYKKYKIYLFSFYFLFSHRETNEIATSIFLF